MSNLIKQRDYADAHQRYVVEGHWKHMEPKKMLQMLVELKFRYINDTRRVQKINNVIRKLHSKCKAMLYDNPVKVHSRVINHHRLVSGTDGGYTWVGKSDELLLKE